jgi:hypothetical protein
MKKLYSIFAFTFLLNFFACLHWSFANENLPKDALPVSRPKPVFKVPFKPLPFKTLLQNSVPSDIVLNPTATEMPFKAIVAPVENQIHVLITPQNVQFIRDQILYRNQNIPAGCTN